VPKQYVRIEGAPVLTRTLSVFLDHPGIDLVQVAIGVGDVASPYLDYRVKDPAAGQLATIETVMDAPMIKSEMGSLTGWVYVDIDTSDVGGYVATAKAAVARDP
jgi:hypothetical protein